MPAELEVIERLLRTARIHRLTPLGWLIRVGDGETEFAVRELGGRGQFQVRQRSVVSRTYTGSTVAVALRYLTFQLAESSRPFWWPMIKPSDYAPGVRLDAVEGGRRLSWDDDWLQVHDRFGVEWEMRPFSWVVRAAAEEVAASFLEPSGAPLFAIDLAKEAPEFPRVLPPDAPHEWYSPETRPRDRPT